MFIRRSTYLALRKQAEIYRCAELEARRAMSVMISNCVQAAERHAATDERINAAERRLERALRACARYRRTQHDRDRYIRILQRRLDDAVGLNSTVFGPRGSSDELRGANR